MDYWSYTAKELQFIILLQVQVSYSMFKRKTWDIKPILQRGKQITFTLRSFFSFYLDDGSLSNNAKRCVHWTIGVFLYSNNVKIKSAFQFRMSHVSFCEPQACRADEALVFWRFSCKTWPHKCDFGNHSLPLLGWMTEQKNQKCPSAW